MLALQPSRSGIQIGRGDDYVIDPHPARILRALGRKAALRCCMDAQLHLAAKY
jgi:hypothetical protein